MVFEWRSGGSSASNVYFTTSNQDSSLKSISLKRYFFSFSQNISSQKISSFPKDYFLFKRSIKEKVIRVHKFESLDEAKERIKEFIEFYNDVHYLSSSKNFCCSSCDGKGISSFSYKL
jgi:hypothetical protein